LRGLLFSSFFIFTVLQGFTQTEASDFPEFSADTIPTMSPEIRAAIDSASAAQDSLRNPPRAPKSDIETTINYNAKDSIIFDMTNQSLSMYGQTHIDYGSMTLEAERTDVDIERKIIRSTFRKDSTGRVIGKPVFTEQEDAYQTDKILYNFDTKRAVISGVVTEQDGAYMHGDNVRKNENDEMFIRGARYTTCDLADPHFYIESDRIKVIPNNKVVSGPFNLRFREVITPLWFPFGMFPQPKRKTSGIIMPSYGEERRRGFFLRDGGYYFAISDYADLRATGSIYSKGTTTLDFTSNYKKRYGFSGTTNLTYNRNISDDVENPLESNSFWFRWNHRQQSRGSSNFSAAVSLGSTSFNEDNNLISQDFGRSIQADYTSNVSYSKTFQGTPFSMNINARQNQNIQTGIMTVTLPDFNLTTQRQYPFKKWISSSSNPLAKLGVSHNFVARNELTNRARSSFRFPVSNANNDSEDTLTFSIDNLDQLLERSKSGGRHQIPVNTSISLLKFLTLSPNFNYQEVWYTKELDFTYLPEEEAVRVDTVQGFSRAGSWSSGASLNTVMYGTYFFKGKGKVQAIRHVITPSVSFSYNPDFSDPSRGVYRFVQTNEEGDSVRVSKYEGFAFGSPSGNESRSMSLSLQNNLELKVKDEEDTVTGYKKVKIFDNLSMNGSYNFAADSFKLSNISWSTRTSFFDNKISLALSGNMDPYIYELIWDDVRVRLASWNAHAATADGYRLRCRELSRLRFCKGSG
jgi:lipopolysaccharide export system protein LptA